MEKKVRQYMEEQHMLEQSDHVIAGVSGGADSVCLLCMLKKMREEKQIADLSVVHVNHNLRGASSDGDQKFVEDLCRKWEIPIYVFQVDPIRFGKEKGLSEEEAGRILRRNCFETVMEERRGTKIALAHHANDNAETLLHNIARGTGLRGMGGIQPVKGKYIRPLLCLKREEIQAYLEEQGQPYCEDETNGTDEYTRNRIRRHIIPCLEESVNEKFVEHAAALMEQMRLLGEYVEQEVDAHFQKAVKEDGGWHIEKQAFEAVPEVLKPYLLQKLLKQVSGKEQDLTAVHLGLVRELFEKQVGKELNLPYEMRAIREYEGVRIEKQKRESFEAEITAECRVFEYDKETHIFPQKTYTKWFDYDIIKDSLILRNRMPGDRITIHENGGSKKIKEYFIHEKIPKEERDEKILLAEGSEILWILGERQSKKYQVTENTKRILEIKINGGRKNGRINQSISVRRRDRGKSEMSGRTDQ